MIVKAIKLISGEELVAEIIHEEFIGENPCITFRNPLVIMMNRTQSGDINVGFVPFAPYLGKHPTITLPMNKIIFVIEVDNQMVEQYMSIFSGIVTPTKQLIVG